MLDPKLFDDLSQKLFAALPEGLKNIEHDLEQRFKDILNLAFTRLDLVTREEFDVQCKVLARTREKVEQLEHQIEALIEKK